MYQTVDLNQSQISPPKNISLQQSSAACIPTRRQLQQIQIDDEDEQPDKVSHSQNIYQSRSNRVSRGRRRKRNEDNVDIEQQLSPYPKQERVEVFSLGTGQEDSSLELPIRRYEAFEPEVHKEEVINDNKWKQLSVKPRKEESNNMEAANLESRCQLAQEVVVVAPDTEKRLDESNQNTVIQNSHYFSSNKLERKAQLTTRVKPNHLLTMNVKRVNSWLNALWPEFHLTDSADNKQVIMAAKRITARPISTFLLSLSTTNFQQNSNNYLGKIKSNAIGSILNIFGPGLSPGKAKQKGEVPREMLATIVYQTSIFSFKPRSFAVYVKKEEFKYYSDFVGVTMYEEEVGINQLCRHKANTQKILVFNNKKPTWNSTSGRYLLNFRGKASMPSAKNFILQQRFSKKQAMLLGKRKDNEFVLQLSDAMSPMIGFCIALSSFDTKFVSESFST